MTCPAPCARSSDAQFKVLTIGLLRGAPVIAEKSTFRFFATVIIASPQVLVAIRQALNLVQALVDLLGVVTTVGTLGSVKRKSDQSELQRRDITLLDQR